MAKAKVPDKKATVLQVGGLVSHNGELNFVVTKIDGLITTFENKGFRVQCSTDELEWFEEDKAWILPGRLLTKEQRILYRQKTNAAVLPPEDHPKARKYLRDNGLI